MILKHSGIQQMQGIAMKGNQQSTAGKVRTSYWDSWMDSKGVKQE